MSCLLTNIYIIQDPGKTGQFENWLTVIKLSIAEGRGVTLTCHFIRYTCSVGSKCISALSSAEVQNKQQNEEER